MTHPSVASEHWDRLADLQQTTQQLLVGLDELGLHQAAAYVSMALDAMRQARPGLMQTG